MSHDRTVRRGRRALAGAILVVASVALSQAFTASGGLLLALAVGLVAAAFTLAAALPLLDRVAGNPRRPDPRTLARLQAGAVPPRAPRVVQLDR